MDRGTSSRNPHALRYHLRFQVIPGRSAPRVAEDLARFCARHGVEEVVLFTNAEEWNTGHLGPEEEEVWLATVRRAKEILETGGLSVSLNPWITVLHTDRGRRLKKGQDFAPMVSPLGERASAVASFADPSWRAYASRQWERFASLGFRLIWVEDDFRFHNHEPLTWGGGFEPLVLERFAARIGRTVTREEVVRAVLAPGEPHPWRRAWMETWRELQLETARLLADAVRRGSGGSTGLGLMSSLPSVHSTEGRDWGMLFGALAETGKPPAHRPHFASYRDTPGKNLSYSMMMLDLQRTFRDPAWECAPEIENFPFTSWNKSDAQTWAEMAVALLQGSDALLLDLFPFLGNRPRAEPSIGRLLDAARPALEWIAARFDRSLLTLGVGIPWKQDAQAWIRTRSGDSLGELDASSLPAGRFLLPFGIPATARPGQPVNALFGSLAWAFSDAELRGLLSGGVLLDGESTSILCERGFGDLVGVDVGARLERRRSDYAVETTVGTACGIPRGLHFSVNNAPWIAVLEPRGGAEVWTKVTDPSRTTLGAGVVAFANPLGGRVVTIAVPEPANLARSELRRKMAAAMVDFLWAGRAPLRVDGGPHLMPMHFRTPDGRREIVVALNGSVDPARARVLLAEGAGKVRATLLEPLRRPREVAAGQRDAGGRTTLSPRRPLPYLGFLVVEREA